MSCLVLSVALGTSDKLRRTLPGKLHVRDHVQLGYDGICIIDGGYDHITLLPDSPLRFSAMLLVSPKTVALCISLLISDISVCYVTLAECEIHDFKESAAIILGKRIIGRSSTGSPYPMVVLRFFPHRALLDKFIIRFVTMSSSSTSSTSDGEMLQAVRKIIPELTNAKYKGQDGKIGIFGGSSEYTGAPYFAAMSALRTGADLVHIFCAKDAGIAIKSFSPEPIVHPILDQPNAIKNIKPWLERFHVVVIGPGLGRDEKVFDVISELIGLCREAKKPAIIDADGLFLVCQRPDLIKDYPGLILTPNAMEFSRLMKACLEKTIEPASYPLVSDVKQVAEFLGKNIVVLHKAAKDVIVNGEKDTEAVICGAAGSGRRCGGQGDLLAGSLGVFWWWALAAGPTKCAVSPALLAAYAACRLIRESNAATFKIKQRGMLASDMLEQIQPVFHRLYETHAK